MNGHNGLMLMVGLTGGIGSGKSLVADKLVQHGGWHIDADYIARQAVAPGTVAFSQLVEAFGEGIVDDDGNLNRKELARRAFADASATGLLNLITHPAIGSLTAELLSRAPEDAIVIHDVPLLVENKMIAHYDIVLVVEAPMELRLERLEQFRAMPSTEARVRIASQATDAERKQVADVVIDNSTTVHAVGAYVDQLWTRLTLMEQRRRSGSSPTVDVADLWSVVAGVEERVTEHDWSELDEAESERIEYDTLEQGGVRPASVDRLKARVTQVLSSSAVLVTSQGIGRLSGGTPVTLVRVDLFLGDHPVGGDHPSGGGHAAGGDNSSGGDNPLPGDHHVINKDAQLMLSISRKLNDGGYYPIGNDLFCGPDDQALSVIHLVTDSPSD